MGTNYQENEISYCVNYKGQKIKPYRSNYEVPKPKSYSIRKVFGVLFTIIAAVAFIIFMSSSTLLLKCGDVIGTFNNVSVYYNDGFNSCDEGRNTNIDGYIYGKKWQCVEFVRRYYKEALNHEMPEYWGDATDYFRGHIQSGSINTERDLIQYHNGDTKPQVNDLLVFDGGYGHVVIVTEVTETTITTISQNIGEECLLKYSVYNDTIGSGCVGLLRLRE
tara:strand:- start:310 stop:969 length:660 start_codon:yes stop_codon:yes gene_type:complete